MVKKSGVSLHPSDFDDSLATSLNGATFNEALGVKWKPIGNRDDRRLDSEAVVIQLKTSISNLATSSHSPSFIEKVASLGAFDLVNNDGNRQQIRLLLSGLRLATEDIIDVSLFPKVNNFVSDKSQFRWSGPVVRGLRDRIRCWSPIVKDGFNSASGDFMAPAVVILQVFMCKWLLTSGAKLGKLSKMFLSRTSESWDERNNEFILRATNLLAECKKHKFT